MHSLSEGDKNIRDFLMPNEIPQDGSSLSQEYKSSREDGSVIMTIKNSQEQRIQKLENKIALYLNVSSKVIRDTTLKLKRDACSVVNGEDDDAKKQKIEDDIADCIRKWLKVKFKYYNYFLNCFPLLCVFYIFFAVIAYLTQHNKKIVELCIWGSPLLLIGGAIHIQLKRFFHNKLRSSELHSCMMPYLGSYISCEIDSDNKITVNWALLKSRVEFEEDYQNHGSVLL